MQRALTVALVVVVLGLAGTAAKYLEARGRVAALLEQLASREESFAEQRSQWSRVDSARAERITRLAAATDSLTDLYFTSQRDARAARGRLARALAAAELPDSTRAAIGETIGALEEESRTCSLALKSCGEQAAEQDARIAGLLGQLEETDSLLAFTRSTLAVIEKAGPASGSKLPWLIAGSAVAVAGLALAF